MKYWAGWITSWNQDWCREGYQKPRICRWHHTNGRKRRGSEEPLNEGERGEWKAGIKLNIWKTKIMASCPITSWQIEGEKVEAVIDFIFLVSKITANGDCSHEIKRSLLLGRKAMTNLDSILKSTDITLMTKVCIVKAKVVMYRESWTLKAGCRRIDASQQWCWRRLESPLDCKEIKPINFKGNLSWRFIGSGLMLKLKLQYSGHLMQRANSLEKTLMLGKIESKKRKGRQKIR